MNNGRHLVTADDALDLVGARTEPGDVLTWLALRHASGGSVGLYGEIWLDGGLRPVALPFDEIRSTGDLVLDGPDPTTCGMRRATLTPAGWARFAALDERHGHRSTRSVTTTEGNMVGTHETPHLPGRDGQPPNPQIPFRPEPNKHDR